MFDHTRTGTRRRRARRIHVSAAVAVLAVIGAFLSTAASARVAAARPTLTIGDSYSTCGDMNPLSQAPYMAETRLVYAPLIQLRPDGSLGPGLATAWSVKPGNKVLTLTLRRNARFSDGTAVTAQAIKVWLDWTQATGTSWSSWMVTRSVDVLSRQVVRITLKTPNPDVIHLLSSDIPYALPISPRAVATMKADPKSTLLSRQTFGAGPYTFDPKQSVTGDHCTFVPNKYYFDQSKIRWGKIVTKSLADANAGLAALRTGEVDLLGRAFPNTVSVARASGFKIVTAPGLLPQGLFMDHVGKLVPALGDARVRQALSFAINRDALLALYGPGASTTSNPANPISGGVGSKYDNYFHYDPARARALLASAGYATGFTFKALCLGSWAGLSDNEALCHAIARDLAAVGVTMDVHVPDGNSFGTELGSGTYSMWFVPVAILTPYTYYLTDLEPKAVLGDQHGWHDHTTDTLFLRAQRLSGKRAHALFVQIMRRAITQVFNLALVQDVVYYEVSKRVGGVAPAQPYYDGGTGVSDPINWYPTKG